LGQRHLQRRVQSKATADIAIGAKEWLERLIERRRALESRSIGAAPCAIERIKNRWRWP